MNEATPPSSLEHSCVVNLGLYRSGTTTLSKAADRVGLRPYRTFPDLSHEEQKEILQNPRKAVSEWYETKEGKAEIIRLASKNDLLCDGWFALLPFLGPSVLNDLKREAAKSGIDLKFLATSRDVESTVTSELQHWVIHNLECKAGLDATERNDLATSLRDRATSHQCAVQGLNGLDMVKLLPLQDHIEEQWPRTLTSLTGCMEKEWRKALAAAGRQNSNPRRPVEGVLLTLRLGDDKDAQSKIDSVVKLLDQIEEDRLCLYMVVLALDDDEKDNAAATKMIDSIKSRKSRQQLQAFHTIINPPTVPGEPFAICQVWDEMASKAWEEGADWVVLLGDDVEIKCPYHYRAFYRSFLDIHERLNVPFGFGCPYWNDTSFPGFPSFPCVGKFHHHMFRGRLIPKHRVKNFINQDLDPYLQRMYSKFNAAPCVKEAKLVNKTGGNIGSQSSPRYERVEAVGWRDFVVDDIEKIRENLPPGTPEMTLLDVVVPSYRVRFDYLESICYLNVPKHLETLFIIVVDNTSALRRAATILTDKKEDAVTLDQGERILEEHLSRTGNNVRVRCNPTNIGASASRNRGLNESSAEFVLNLDDDLIPNPDLLEQYGRKLNEIDHDVVGLIGLVRFPRSPTLPLRHAAVLMSYLTFMFEIAERSDMYKPCGPAWGVTANILFRRTHVRFDLAYAKTGGGEDVDFSLRVTAASNGGRLLTVPEACVVHPFWPGSVFTLSSHFFNWAIGDGSLFKRFPAYRYWSFPNLPETMLLLSPFSLLFGPWAVIRLLPWFVAGDFLVDFAHQTEYHHRCLLLEQGPDDIPKRSQVFYFLSHLLANAYVIVLECGRLWGHFRRLEPLEGFSQRFDWHIGRLQDAPAKFRRREAYKFGIFCAMAACNFASPHYWPMVCGAIDWKHALFQSIGMHFPSSQ